VPEDSSCTSVVIDGATYQRLSHAARFNPKDARANDIEESKRNQQWIEVYYPDYGLFN
jgi:hypothetical protein